MFTFVPAAVQPIYVSAVTFIWNIWLSLLYMQDDQRAGKIEDSHLTEAQVAVSRRLSSNGGGGGL